MGDYIITRDSSDHLQHFGIKGQKWGVRRFENEDGTLTEAGKKRYARAEKIASREKYNKNQIIKRAGKAAMAGAAVGTIAGQAADRIVKKKAFDKATSSGLGLVDFNDPDFKKKTDGFQWDPNNVINTGFHTVYENGKSRRVNDYSYAIADTKFVSPGKAAAFGKLMSLNLLTLPSYGAAVGAGAGAIGSLAVSAIHNKRIDRAQKFVSKYAEAYKNTKLKDELWKQRD